jgi:hypothetical protein
MTAQPGHLDRLFAFFDPLLGGWDANGVETDTF